MHRVMLVDENVQFLEEMGSALTRNGYEVVGTARNGEAALKTVMDLEPDILIIDIILSVVDGVTVLQQIRECGLRQMRIFVATGMTSQDVATSLSNLDVSSFFVKPVDIGSVVRRIGCIVNNIPIGGPDLLDRDARIMRSIGKLMHRVGAPPQVKGYTMVVEAIYMVVQNPRMLHSMTSELYRRVAISCDSTPSRVERNIRQVVQMIWDRCRVEVMNEYFGNTLAVSKDKPNNTEFICTMAEHVRMLIL